MSIQILKQTLASLFKRKSAEVVKPKELEMLISMELRWFEPNDARKLVELSKDLGLLIEYDLGLKPDFDYLSVNIPIGFRPPKNLLLEFKHDQESLFMQIVNQICLTTSLSEEQVIAEINKLQTDLNEMATLETVAILYADKKGVDVKSHIEIVKKKLLEI